MSENGTYQRQQLPYALGVLCALTMLFSLGCHKHRRLETRVKQLDERVTLLELRRSETESELRKVTEVRQALEEQLATSNQHNRMLQKEINGLKAETQALKSQVQALEARLKTLEQARIARAEAEKNQPVTTTRPRRTKPTNQANRDRSRGVTRAYRAAIKLLQEGKNDAAAETLRTIGKDHPNHVLAPNAHYWLGEIAYDKRQYGAAIQAFQRVLNTYPNSGKAPDSLLKIGKSLERQDKLEDARKAYESVIKRFPKSRAATLARSWLK